MRDEFTVTVTISSNSHPVVNRQHTRQAVGIIPAHVHKSTCICGGVARVVSAHAVQSRYPRNVQVLIDHAMVFR